MKWLITLIERATQLREAGRKLSKESQTQIRTAIEALQALLDAATATTDTADDTMTEAEQPAAELTEAELSFDEQRRKVSRALRDAHPGTYPYVSDIYPSAVVYAVYDGGMDSLWMCDYSIAEDGTVTFGTSVAVQSRMVYEPCETAMQESALTSDCVALVEKAVRRDGTVPIKIIAPGWGSSGYYPADVLERDGPSVFKKGLHTYWNHPTASEEVERPERNLDDLAGVLTSDARWESAGTDGPGLYADVEVRPDYQEAVNNLADWIGVSIRASGRARPGTVGGRTGPVIEALTSADSVDYVTRPGAGGKVLSLFEAARRPASSAVAPPPTPTPAAAPAATIKESTVTNEELQALRESIAAVQADATATKADNARLREALIIRDADAQVERTLAGANTLLDATKNRIRESLRTQRNAVPVIDGALDAAAYGAVITAAIESEQAYLAQLGAGQVRDLGATTTEMSESDADAKLTAALQALGLSEAAAKGVASR